MTHRFTFLALLLVVAAPAIAQLPTTQLTSIFPAGARQGGTAEVTIAGADMDDVTELHFSHPGLAATPQMTPATDLMPTRPVPNKFTANVAQDTPPGIYEVRAHGRFGLSNPRLFVVGTGGRNLYPVLFREQGSEVHDTRTFGVLALTLHPDRYDWRFVPIPGSTSGFTDEGSAGC